LTFHGRNNKYGERNADNMAYLVPQGQKEVIEEDGCSRDCIILVAIARSQSRLGAMKVDAHLSCITGDIVVERWGKSNRGRDERKSPYNL